MIDPRDNKRILGIIGFAVGEKDGKLLLVRERRRSRCGVRIVIGDESRTV